MGNALAARLFYSLKRNNIPILFEADTKDFVVENNIVSGVKLDIQDVQYLLKARKGVVLATGGYGHHKKLREMCMPKPTPDFSMVCPSVTGDGIELGMRLGGSILPEKQKPGGFWTPVSVTYRNDGTTGLYPHLSLDRAKPGLIAVNKDGKRFVNEGVSYHDFVEAMFADNQKSLAIPAYLICEASFVEKYGLGNIHPGTKNLMNDVQSGYIKLSDSLEGLANQLEIPADQLQKTVERHNQFARTGKDLDFGKGDTELNRFNGDLDNLPNPCLKPIENGPFVGIRIWPAEIGTSAGLEANKDGQVLDSTQKAIEGLYVCGNDMASMMMGTYPGPGTTLGPAMTFAYRVAMHAAMK
jgi:succinate dehydrogenase/fumarate reductase flavoprotein subunit